MKKEIRQELQNIRQELYVKNTISTKEVFEKILDYYKSMVLKASRKTMDYTIDIALSNVNGYNKLGGIDNLYKNWDDKYFIDFNNSAFVENIINETGNMETGNVITFDNTELQVLKDTPFSLKEIISLCKEYDFRIRLIAKNDYDTTTSIEIILYESYLEDTNIKIYLNSIKE
ncbi:MAG: hypothetical protein Q4G04_05475 [bacterium]|nr:hypothetical protein [bacterium]